MRTFWISLGLLFTVACAGGEDDKSTDETTDETSGDDDATESDTNSGDDEDDGDDTNETEDTESEWTDPGDGESPLTRNGEVYCCTIGGDAGIVTFFASLEFEDPQGNSTIESGWTVNASVSGSLVNSIPMYGCQVDGTCASSWGESYYSVSCDNIDNYDFEAVIIDEDGNEGTEPLVVVEHDTGC